LFPLFSTGVIDTCGNDTCGNLPLVSTTLAANLPPVLKTLAKLVSKFAAGVIDTDGKFAGGGHISVGAP
jgi:hypothetical protein